MFTGSYVAMITPFSNGRVDEIGLRKMVDWQIDNGSDGLVPVGTTGEASTVTAAEHLRVVAVVVEQAAGRVPVVAGAGSNNPAESLELVLGAQAIGANAVLCVAGYYNRPSQDGLFAHFNFLHQHSDIPIVVYNIPARTIVDIEPVTMAGLAALPRIVGVKDATGDLARIALERAAIGDNFSYLSGEDSTALAYNAMGGGGCISVSANVVPRWCAQLQQACRQGDYARARQLQYSLLPLHCALTREPSPAGIKYAVSLLGLCKEEARLPIMGLAASTKEEIRRALDELENSADQLLGEVRVGL